MTLRLVQAEISRIMKFFLFFLYLTPYKMVLQGERTGLSGPSLRHESSSRGATSVPCQSYLKLKLPDRRRSRKAEEGVDVSPSMTDDNAAGGDEMVILVQK